MDADADARGRPPVGLSLGIVGRHGLGDGKAGAAGPEGVVLLNIGRTPECHQRIADVLVYGALLRFHAAGEQREVLVQEAGDLGRRQPLGHGREAGDIGEHDGEHALFGADLVVRMAGDQLAHQPARHIALERPEAAQHGVEGARLLVQLADVTARQRRHLAQIQTTDLGAFGGDATDRPREEAAQDDSQKNGENGDGQSNRGPMAQAVHGLHGVLHGHPGAQLPGDRAVVIDLLGRDEVGVIADVDVQDLDAIGLERLHPRLDLPARQGRQHEIADPIDPDDRHLFAQFGMRRHQGRMRQHILASLQDEDGCLAIIADIGHELGQLRHGDQAGEKTQILAVSPDRPAEVQIGCAVEVHEFVPSHAIARLDLFDVSAQAGRIRTGCRPHFERPIGRLADAQQFQVRLDQQHLLDLRCGG